MDFPGRMWTSESSKCGIESLKGFCLEGPRRKWQLVTWPSTKEGA